MSALAKWLTRWQPIAIHSAVLAGARMEAIAGGTREQSSGRLRALARVGIPAARLIVNGNPGITKDEYDAVAQQFAAAGIPTPRSRRPGVTGASTGTR